MRHKTIALIGILALTGIEVYALHCGHDGTALTATVAGITAIIGYVFGRKQKND